MTQHLSHISRRMRGARKAHPALVRTIPNAIAAILAAVATRYGLLQSLTPNVTQRKAEGPVDSWSIVANAALMIVVAAITVLLLHVVARRRADRRATPLPTLYKGEIRR